MARIDAFLKLGLAQGCSDVHLAVGVPPMLRLHGDLMPIKFRDLGDTELEGYVDEILTESQRARFKQGHDLDFSYVSEESGRFRVNLFRKVTGVGATFRNIPAQIPSLESLNLPPVITRLCDLHQGMVLVTGSTGTGKSTTLAAMIDHLNTTRSLNIISLEDPIEFIHPSKRSQIIQRELGTHIHSFADGVRSALREDPDVILVGELRDGETIGMAMTAAETGHLVMGTLHTNSAPEAIDRIIDVFPEAQQEQVRVQLANNLVAILTQQLLPKATGGGRALAYEFMVSTPAIANLIREGKTHQILSSIQTGGQLGMITMDACLADLHLRRVISYEMGRARSVDANEFDRLVGTGGSSAGSASTSTPAATPSRGDGRGGFGGGGGGGGRGNFGRGGR